MGTYASAPTSTRPAKFCAACSDIIDRMAVVCPKCGVMQPTPPDLALGSEKRLLPTFLFALLLGTFGAHRFYVGRPVSAVLMLLTLGGLGIWYLVDLILLIAGSFKEATVSGSPSGCEAGDWMVTRCCAG